MGSVGRVPINENTAADVVIVGSGLMGAAVARGLRDADPELTILMVDGGPPLGSVSGRHLHDVTDPELRKVHNHRVSSGIQGFYTGTTPTPGGGPSVVDAMPGMYHLESFGQHTSEMPAAAVAWNVGGMGVHWTAGTPTPWGAEVNPFIPAAEWSADLDRAAELLLVNPEPFPPTEAGLLVLEQLQAQFGPRSAAGRHPQLFPMAVNADASGHLTRTGPEQIFPAIGRPDGDPAFTLLAGSLALAVEHDQGRATGVRVKDVTSGEERVLSADAVVLCADTMRTPQLLFASHIRPPALGRYLNEHVSLTGRVVADPARLGFEIDELSPPSISEWTADSLWVPFSGPKQPFQFQVMNSVAIDDDEKPIAYVVGLGSYVPTEVRAENRLEFSETETDFMGLPRITVHFDYTEADEQLIAQGRLAQQELADRLGPFDPETESARLPAGSSLHFTGTVRMGEIDDGTSVCDTDCRVWGFANLYVAGNGVIPTPLACNSTLTGMTTAVRAARAVLLAGERSAS